MFTNTPEESEAGLIFTVLGVVVVLVLIAMVMVIVAAALCYYKHKSQSSKHAISYAMYSGSIKREESTTNSMSSELVDTHTSRPHPQDNGFDESL